MVVGAEFLRCEYMVEPRGIDVAEPRLSWLPTAPASAYEVRVGDWSTGRVEGPHPVYLSYGGPPLPPASVVEWSVRLWGLDGVASEWATAWFDTGIDSWSASWVAPPDSLREPAAGSLAPPAEDWASPPPVLLRSGFSLPLGRSVVSARAYVSARGVYTLWLNGAEVGGDDVLKPGWTDYRHRIQYQVFDVTSAVQAGDNAIGVTLADGWWCGKLAWLPRQQWGDHASALVELRVTLDDGSVQRVVSDSSWRCSTGPWLWSDLLIGEAYDARAVLEGWSTASFDDSGWARAVVEEPPAARLVGIRTEPVRRTQEIAAVSVSEPSPGAWVFDLGQNMVGRVRLRVSGPAGTVVRLRHGEMCNPDGTLYTQNLRSAAATDFYVLAGSGVEEWEPSFTFHGFRYVEVTGLPSPSPSLDAVTGVVLGTDLDVIGSFECSNEMVNQLQRNIVWGQRGNFLEAPTDCPQRDERLGWTGDAQVFAPTACFNMDAAGFFGRWMQEMVDGQHASGLFPDVAPLIPGDVDRGAPAWADAGVIVPWTVYQCFGDERLLANCFDAACRFVDGLDADNPTRIRRTPGKHEYGDWLSVEATTPKDVLATAYFAESARLVARMAEVLGRDDEAKRFQALWEDIRRAFIEAYVTPTGRVVGHTQTTYVLALAFDLLPFDQRSLALGYLVEDIESRGWHLSTGFLGVGLLLPVLADCGRLDVAYRLLLQDTFPSWGYSIKHGATTIWERWDGWTEENGFQIWHMNSFNHYSLGSVGAWLYTDVLGLGIGPVPGYGQALIRPRPGGGLTWARGSYRSPHGVYSVSWQVADGSFVLDVGVPAGASGALVELPDSSVHEVGPGDHRFTCALSLSLEDA
jgi:alpha-L-rhamnosidase